MIELLKLCGYEQAEIQTELPRVKKAFGKLGLTDKDIELGKQRLRKYFDMELEGIRKVFRLCLREFVDSMLVREEGKTRVLYGFMAPRYEIIGAAVMAKSEEIYSINHCWAFMEVVGCIFNRMNPVLEAAERMWLKGGQVSHCGNVKALLGAFALGLFPKPDLLITSGGLCETAPKTLDLLHECYDIPVYFYETCQDRDFHAYGIDSIRAFKLEARSLRKMTQRMQEVVGFEITDSMLQESLEARKKLDVALGKMRSLLLNSNPLALSPTHESLWACLGSLTLYKNSLEDAVGAVNILCGELQERINQGRGVVEKDSPRVLAICPGHQSDPSFEYLVNDLGIAMVAIDSIFSYPYEGETQDPYIKLALPLQSIRFLVPSIKIPLLIEGSKRLKVDGVIGRYHAGCRTVAGDALIIKEAVEKELDIPVLVMEWENFDPRVFDYQQYRNKLEVFRAVMLNRMDIPDVKQARPYNNFR